MDLAFFVVAKAAWALLRPETLLFLLLAGGVAGLAAGWRRTGLLVAGAGVAAYLAIAIWPVASPLYRPLEMRFPPQPDVAAPAGIVVLGGGEEFGLRPGLPQLHHAGDRFVATMALARRFPDVPVMFTGGEASLSGGAGRQAETVAEILRQGGVAPERIVLENRSRNTAENAANGLALRPEGTEAGPWILVTSAWHMPRAVGTFCAAGWEGIVPWPTDYRSLQRGAGWRFARHLEELNTAAKEWVGLVGYRVTGRSDALFPAGCPPVPASG
jgi:uncharacterized SAM-binding protein YcdF (DUF218 family)